MAVKRRQGDSEGLTITSLMDAMTIILIFLLKSYSVEDVQVSPSDDLRLPTSSASKSPEVAVNVVVSQTQILVDGDEVCRVEDGTIPEDFIRGNNIIPLYDALLEKADEAKAIAQRLPDQPFKGRLLLQVDRNIPFSLVREVMYSAG
jgi:biopolymer transport protein ExbD